MKFSQAPRLERDEGRCQCLRNGEVGRIDLVELSTSTWDLLCRMLEGVVDVRCVTSYGGRSDSTLAHGTVEDIRIGCRKVGKNAWVNPEVLCNYISRGMRQPVVDHEGGAEFVSN